MVWWHRATSHYLNICWARSTTPQSVMRPRRFRDEEKHPIITMVKIIPTWRFFFNNALLALDWPGSYAAQPDWPRPSPYPSTRSCWCWCPGLCVQPPPGWCYNAGDRTDHVIRPQYSCTSRWRVPHSTPCHRSQTACWRHQALHTTSDPGPWTTRIWIKCRHIKRYSLLQYCIIYSTWCVLWSVFELMSNYPSEWLYAPGQSCDCRCASESTLKILKY